MQQRPQIEHGSTHEQGYPPARVDLSYGRRRIGDEASSRIALGWIGNIDEMVRNVLPQLPTRLGTTDIQTAIHESGVHANDLERSRSRKPLGPLALSGARWPGEDENGQGRGSARRRPGHSAASQEQLI